MDRCADADGQVRCVLAIVADVWAQQQAEGLLRETQCRLAECESREEVRHARAIVHRRRRCRIWNVGLALR